MQIQTPLHVPEQYKWINYGSHGGKFYYQHVLEDEIEWGSGIPTSPCRCWWNGRRWMVWVKDVLVCEASEFTDPNAPPTE